MHTAEFFAFARECRCLFAEDQPDTTRRVVKQMLARGQQVRESKV